MRLAPLFLLFGCIDDASGITGEPGTGGVDGVTSGECWQATWFPPLDADPANAGYDDPLTTIGCDGSEVRVQSNGIPDFEFVAVTPNDLGEQDWDFSFPESPEVAGSTSEIPLLGPVGVSVNGLPLFGPNEGEFPDPYGDPVYNGIVDFCLGHTAQQGMYHFHAMLEACAHKGFDRGADQASPVIAFAFDGFPIYGSWGCVDAECTEVVEYRSGWEQSGDPSTYAWDNYTYVGGEGTLDACNGHVGPEGDYHYHATADFPYLVGCYAGTSTEAGFDGPMP